MNFFFLVLIEFITFWTLTENYGFLSTLTWYWVPSFFAILLLGLFARPLFARVQRGTIAVDLAHSSSIHSLGVLAGLLLCLFPLVSSRVLGVLLILPGTRHLIFWRFRNLISQKIRENMQNSQGGSGFRFYHKNFNWPPSRHGEESFDPSRSVAGEIIEAEVIEKKTE